MAHPAAAPLTLSRKQERKVRTIVASARAGQAVVRRARIVLLAAEGLPNTHIAARLGCSLPTVRTWREPFRRRGVPGLFDRPAAVARSGTAPASVSRWWPPPPPSRPITPRCGLVPRSPRT